jgi:hypothetical protein
LQISNLIKIVCVIALIGTFACETKPKKRTDNSEIAVITLDYLVKHFKTLHGQKIETKGTVFIEFENVAICTPKKLFSGERNCFWLDVDSDSNLDYNVLDKRSGQKLVVTGVVDTTSKGHLSDYLATLRHVDFPKLTNLHPRKLPNEKLTK